MSDTRDDDFANRIAQYIDATDEGLDELLQELGSERFVELSKHVWTHEPCLTRRLAVLAARRLAENGCES